MSSEITSIALSSALQAKQYLQMITNDLANKETAGYKYSDFRTKDSIYSSINRSSTNDAGESPVQLQLGTGSKVSSITRMNFQGVPRYTKRNLDLAIIGSGYFSVKSNGKFGYTRDGRFHIGSNGKLYNESGNEIDCDADFSDKEEHLIEFKKDGKVYYKDQEIGKIKIYTFINDQGLDAKGENIFHETDLSGKPEEKVLGIDHACIQAGCIESSNVEPMIALQQFMEVNEMYQLAIKIMESVNKMNNNVAEKFSL